MNLPIGNKNMEVTLKNALYTPKMSLTLVSTNHITLAGFTVQFKEDMCKIISPAPQQETIAEIPQINGLYTILTPFTYQAHAAHEKLFVQALH